MAKQSPTTCLDIQQLAIAFANRNQLIPVVKDVTFQLDYGKTLAVVGESGAGKSMIAQAIMQCLPHQASIDTQSIIKFQNLRLDQQSEQQMCNIRGQQIGMIFQDAMTALNPVLAIGKQIDESIRLHHDLPKKDRYRQAITLLKEVGIQDPERCYNSYPHQLSGGMLQRALVASVLATQPKLLIADEPTTALDVTVQAQLLKLVKSLQAKYQMSILFITHDLLLVKEIADDVLVLKKGQVIEYNNAAAFFARPQHQYSKALLKAAMPGHRKPIHRKMPTMLSAQNINVQFTGKRQWHKWGKKQIVQAVDHVSLELKKGKTLALIGESGSGKTSFAKALVDLNPISAGEINWHKSIRPHRDVGMVFQNPYSSMNPRMNVFDILAEGVYAHPKVLPGHATLEQYLKQLLDTVELPHDALQRYPHQFSGGERQRLCIARSLALRPKILILDEPTSALDVSIQAQIIALLKKIQQDFKLSYLLITHDFVVVSQLAHEVAVMQHGKIVEQGLAETILSQPSQPYTQALLNAVPGQVFGVVDGS